MICEKLTRKAPEQENSFKKESAFLLKLSVWDNFQFLFVQNQPLGFSVSGASTPSGLFQIINKLKRSNGLLQMISSTIKHGVLLRLKMKNLEIFVYC